MIAGPPRGPVETPRAVRELAGGDTPIPVWQNQLGGITFQAGTGGDRRFIKWSPARCGVDPGLEAERLAWAAPFTPVPPVLTVGGDRTGSWLVTGALPGQSAVSPRWTAEPGMAVDAIGRGLRAFHDALPADRSPFTWSVERRRDEVHRRAADGLIDPAAWHPEHRERSVAAALSTLATPPPVDRLVVCHGDACAPNTLLGDDGRWSGHVDLGALGTADRWADLAIATWSTEWNYGPGWEGRLLAAYGVPADAERQRFYRLLWDLGP